MNIQINDDLIGKKNKRDKNSKRSQSRATTKFIWNKKHCNQCT